MRAYLKSSYRERPPLAQHLLVACSLAVTVFATPATQARDTDEIVSAVRRDPGMRKVIAKVPGDQSAVVGALDVVGTPPDGFGRGFDWNRSAPQLTLVAFINSADSEGVYITNVKAGDLFEIESATGIASFSHGHGKAIRSAIGVAGAGGTLLLPEAAPLITAGTKFAQDMFGRPSAGKQRDAFGIEGRKLRRCEGGILVTWPEALGVYDSKGGCIKGKDTKDGHRTDSRRPDHVKHGFFLARWKAHNRRFVPSDGPMHLVAWDRKFEDNQGYYQVMIRLTRGDAVLPPVID